VPPTSSPGCNLGSASLRTGSNRGHHPVLPTFAAAILATLLLGGCATAPENIAPIYVSDFSYSNWTCKQMAEEQPRLVAALATASAAQTQARNDDIAGVILIGLPVSSLSGSNMAHEVARLKGELQALQRAAILKNCSLPAVRVEEPPSPKPQHPETVKSDR
jgi:hypothetical protein